MLRQSLADFLSRFTYLNCREPSVPKVGPNYFGPHGKASSSVPSYFHVHHYIKFLISISVVCEGSPYFHSSDSYIM